MEGGLLGLLKRQPETADAAVIADGLLLMAKDRLHDQPQQAQSAHRRTRPHKQHSPTEKKPFRDSQSSSRPATESELPAGSAHMLDLRQRVVGPGAATQTAPQPPPTMFDDLRYIPECYVGPPEHPMGGSDSGGLLKALANLIASHTADPKVNLSELCLLLFLFARYSLNKNKLEHRNTNTNNVEVDVQVEMDVNYVD